jgi:hypothetical protein
MEKLNTYVELPYIGTENYDSDFVSAFGYMDIKPDEINQYIIARQFRDNCDENCACDRDYYNPAFLMLSGKFSEAIESNNTVLSESILLLDSTEAVDAKIAQIQAENAHGGNDLIVYQLRQENSSDRYVTLHADRIIKANK